MYDRRVLALLADFGLTARHIRLPGSYPDATEADLAETRRLLADLGADTPVIIDGLAYGAMPAHLIEAVRAPIIALVHHPLCLEAGVAPKRQAELYALEKAALALARRVIVTSPTTAQTLTTDFAVPADRITVAVPGTDPAPRATGTGTPLQVLAVGSVVPRKAYEVLVRALVPLRDRDWRLTVAGATDRSAEALAALQKAVSEGGLGGRVTIAGPVETHELARMYVTADLFVLPSLFEGYGMVLAEAMARGLPIVCTTGGAAAKTAPDDAALKVAPGDERALNQAIGRVMDDAGLRRRMSDASWAAGQVLPRWEDTARNVAGAVAEVAP